MPRSVAFDSRFHCALADFERSGRNRSIWLIARSLTRAITGRRYRMLAPESSLAWMSTLLRFVFFARYG